MERLNRTTELFAFVLVFALGCATDSENQAVLEKKQTPEEKKAIEFLKSKGGRFTWWDPKINHKKEPVEPFWFASLGGETQHSDADLDHLKQIKRLKYLAIGSPNVTDQGVAVLSELDQLEDLSIGVLQDIGIGGSSISDRGVDKLADIKTLEKLTLGGMKLSAKAFERFGQLEKLKHLKFYQTIPEDGLRGLKTLKRLEHLDVSEAKVADEDLKFLKDLDRLEVLNLSKTQVTDFGMAELIDVPRLKRLSLADTSVGNEGLKLLARSKTLATLGLDNTKIGDDGLAHIAAVENLTYLGLMNTGISDEGLKHLRKTKLTELKLAFAKNHKITDKGLEYLQDIKTLKRVWIEGTTKVTEGGIRQLRKALPDASIGRPTK